MHLIITDARGARTRAIRLGGVRLVLAVLLVVGMVAALAAGLAIVLGFGAPIAESARTALTTRSEAVQRERFLRENLDAMARKLGDLQARLIQLESLGERVSGLAGLPPTEAKAAPGLGGAQIAARPVTLDELKALLDAASANAETRADLLTFAEARLFDQKMRASMLPTRHPVETAVLGSPFGWRLDPFSGRSALHTGLDFQADAGAPIVAAAGGVVVTQEFHPAYGHMVEIQHAGDIVTRYAHASKVFVRQGEVVKRGQKIAEVGSSGRSTGPHLHFEVLVGEVPQDPRTFLDKGSVSRPGAPRTVDAATTTSSRRSIGAVGPVPTLQPTIPGG